MSESNFEHDLKEHLIKVGSEMFETIEKGNYATQNEFNMTSSKISFVLTTNYNGYLEKYFEINDVSDKPVYPNLIARVYESDQSVLAMKAFIVYTDVLKEFNQRHQSLREKLFPPEIS